MKLKSNWSKFTIYEKIMIILFLAGLFFLITGILMLIIANVNQFFNGFNLIYRIGVISSLRYYEANNIFNLILLKTGIINIVFLMPITSGTSIIWFIINRIFF